MGAGTIITVLSSIPWDKVMENAPKVADAAVKLWKMVGNRKKQSDENEQKKDSPDVHLPESDLLMERVQTLEESVKCLQNQMQASSELIRELADQNIQLIQRVELNRIYLARLAIGTGLGGAILLGAIIYLLLVK